MNTRSGEDRVIALLQQVDQRRAPSDGERRTIEHAMWLAFDRAHTDSEQRSGNDGLSTLAAGSLSGAESGDEPEPTGFHRAWYVAAAVILLVVAIPLGSYLLRSAAPVDETAVSVEPLVRFSATVGEVPLSFEATEPASLGESASDYLAVVATNAENPYDTSNSVSGRVMIARPTQLFNGEDPSAWFARYGLQVDELVGTHGGRQIQGWNLIVPEGSVADQNCEPRTPCLTFAQLGAGRALSLEQGFELNRIWLIPVEDGGPPMVVFSIASGLRQGRTLDPVLQLSSQILASLRLGGCALTC